MGAISEAAAPMTRKWEGSVGDRKADSRAAKMKELASRYEAQNPGMMPWAAHLRPPVSPPGGA